MTDTGLIQKVKMKSGGQGLRFDVNTLLDDVYGHMDVPDIIRQALDGAVSWQQRNETSLARFLAGAGQFPAFALALLACGASVQAGDAELDLHNYLTAKQSVKAGFVLLPVEVSGLKLAAARVGFTPAGEGIVLAAAGVVLQDGRVKSARLALSGVWSGRQWISAAADGLVGSAMTDDAIQTAVRFVQDEVDPPTDHLGGSAYRRAMAGVLTRQVLEACR